MEENDKGIITISKKTEEIKRLKAIVKDKENAMRQQIEYTDEFRNDNREMRTLLTRLYYAVAKTLPLVKEHDEALGMKLGKEMHRTKVKYLNQEPRN